MSIVVDPAFGFVGPGSPVVGGTFRETGVTSTGFEEVATRLRGKSKNLGDVQRDLQWRAELASAPWWLWWNVLSLDAPLVACVWAEMFARCAGMRVPESELGALFLSVWLIYTLDRLLDGKNAEDERLVGAFGGALRQRHIFHVVYRKSIACAAVVVAVCAALLVFGQMNAVTFAAGLVMLCAVGGYMAWIHAGKAWKIGVAPKEFAVGMIFAAGASLPVWSRFEAMGLRLVTAVILFGAVCWLNCVAIDSWEKPQHFARFAGRWLKLRASRRVMVLSCAIAACGVTASILDSGQGFSALAGAIACSAGLIAVLDSTRERLSAEALRVFVDLALVAPAVVAMVIPFSR